MLNSQKLLIFLCFVLCSTFSIQAQITNTNKGKNPIIIIPGLTGSELINSKTGETVWFKAQRSKDDDIRLPISSLDLSQNKDSLVAGDVIRGVQFLKILPEIEIYQKLIDALQTRGGYTEGKWDNPTIKGYEDTFYVFGYDWRLDNVENAQILIRKIEDLKKTLKRPNLKFNIIAHSMGGLISRYAAMYGTADLPKTGKPRPTWAGSKHFSKVFLLGTPNEGSTQSLSALINGFSYLGGGLNLPFVQDVSKFDTFTIPSIYQLLPHSETLRAFDENLKPLDVDIFDVKTWEEYGWSVIEDDSFKKNFTIAEQKNAKDYFQAVLTRAKHFQEALDANVNAKTSVQMYLIGADCKDTLDGFVVYRDKKDEWKTLFKADGFTRANGEKVVAEEIKKILFSMGDGVVPKRSLTAETLTEKTNKTILPVTAEISVCEGHTKLVTSPDVQDKLFAYLLSEAAK